MARMAAIPIGASVGKRWRVDKLLGEGGFGSVYLVSDPTGQYALKAEEVESQIRILKMEVYVLMELSKIKGRHFVQIADIGRFGNVNYMVMTLVGKSLEDLVKTQPGNHFSLGTALSVSIMALESVEDLHRIGYLHRDVKPGNFAVGRPERNELRKLYALDFGMCRKFTGNEGVIRRPRRAAGFRGTPRYASISAHSSMDLCRRDDVESWLYMMIEYTVGRLPWHGLDDISRIGDEKNRCRAEPGLSEMLQGTPPEYRLILQELNLCSYYDEPTYARFYTFLRGAFQTMKVKEFPYDWEAQYKTKQADRVLEDRALGTAMGMGPRVPPLKPLAADPKPQMMQKPPRPPAKVQFVFPPVKPKPRRPV